MAEGQIAKREKTKQLIAELSMPKRRNKFNAVKVTLDGHTFDSKAEAKRYGELKLLEKAGKISKLEVHPKFDLAINGHVIARYTADFEYMYAGRLLHVEDVKSAPTAKRRDFILIRKLMKAIHGIDVEVLS